MGRRRRKLLKRQRGKQTVSKPHESEPERPYSLQNEEDGESIAWDSLDEINLPPTPSGAEYLPSPDEMDVTRRFSCLNFSMLPSDAVMTPEPDIQRRVEHNRQGAMAADVDLNALGDHFDILPCLSDQEHILEMNRQMRKRPSRRKPNKRIKKLRHSLNTRDSLSKSHTFSTQHSLCVSFVRPTINDPQFSRSRSFRRERHPKGKLEDDPLLCFFSDTSVICDVDGHEHMDESHDLTPPTQQSVGRVEECEGMRAVLNDSELSETTSSDSGCEGDDEESSVEGPLHRHNQLSGRTSIENSSSSEDEQFTRILQRAYPLMSAEGQQLYHNLSEFKHPGRLGVGAKGGRKKRCKPAQLSNSLTLMEVNQQMIKFIQDSTENELRFNLVSRALCRTISCLANVYNLDCYIEQKRRLPVASPLLRKSLLTRLASRHEIEPILRNHGRESPTMLLRESLPHSRSHPLVGQGIPPLSESNVGNRMLRNMGWSPGTGLGLHGNGIKDPPRAELRQKKTGLGYS